MLKFDRLGGEAKGFSLSVPSEFISQPQMGLIKGNGREGANRFELKCLVCIMSSISCTRHLTNSKDGRPCDKAKSLADVQHIKNKHWVVKVDKGLPSLHLESCPLFSLPHQMANCQVSGTVDANPPEPGSL